MKTVYSFIVMLIISGFISCGGGSSSSDTSDKDRRIHMQFTEGSTASQTAGYNKISKAPEITPNVEGLYFTSLEIVAYQYSPGYQDTGGYTTMYGETNTSTDWAVYRVLKRAATWDVIVQSDATLDINKLNADTEGETFPVNLDDHYYATFNSFRMDFIEVSCRRPGLIVDNKYYGACAVPVNLITPENNILKMVPAFVNYEQKLTAAWLDIIPDTVDYINILFARSDWFPIPLTVKMNHETHKVIFDSTFSLTAEQTARLESLTTNGSKEGKRYENFLIIPYDGPVVMTFDGIDNGGQTNLTKVMRNPLVTVKFDLSWDTLLTTQSKLDYADADPFLRTTQPNRGFTFALNNNIPFGLSLSVAEAPVE